MPDLFDQNDDFSRFRRTQSVTVGGTVTYGSWARPSWLVERPSGDLVHKLVVSNDLAGKPNLISLRVYGTELLDWVIVSFNNATDLDWPKVGDVVEYPDDSVVFPEL